MVEIGGVAKKKAHPSGAPATGGPQMVEVSRDGKRVYFTNSLYSSWDDQFYDDIKGWFVKADVNPNGGIELDKNFFMDFGDQELTRSDFKEETHPLIHSVFQMKTKV